MPDAFLRFAMAVPPLAAIGIPTLADAKANAADGASVCGTLLRAAFVESAPRDRFEFANGSSAGWRVAALTLDLEGSAGRLVFDTAEGGVGVEVFQPFRAEEGPVRLRDARVPGDGEERLALEFDESGSGAFVSGETFVFSIDVDDRLADSELGQIRVSGSEIEGGRLSVELVHDDGMAESLAGRLDERAVAELVGTPCPG